MVQVRRSPNVSGVCRLEAAKMSRGAGLLGGGALRMPGCSSGNPSGPQWDSEWALTTVCGQRPSDHPARPRPAWQEKSRFKSGAEWLGGGRRGSWGVHTGPL